MAPSVLDPGLIASVLGRVQRIAALIDEAGQPDTGDAAQEDMSIDAEQPMVLDAVPAAAPNVALGAVADDDDGDTFLFGDTPQHAALPADLAHRIATEATALRDVFSRAREAIDALPGGDLNIEAQHDLLARLEKYAARQEYVSAHM